MIAFLIRRFLILLPSVLGVCLLVALLLELAMLGPRWRGEAAGGQTLALFRELVVGMSPAEIGPFLGNNSEPTLWREIVGGAAWASLRISGMVIVIALAFGPILGVMAGRFRRFRWFEAALFPWFALAWIPGFWLAILAVWWQVQQWGQPGYAGGEAASAGPVNVEIWWHAALAAIPVAFIGIGWQIRFIAGHLRRAARQPHVRAAYARGMGGAPLFYRHVFGNSLQPLIRSLDRSLPAMLGMQIIVEWALRFPGLGRLVVESARASYFAGLLAGGLIFAVFLVIARWMGETVTQLLSPSST